MKQVPWFGMILSVLAVGWLAYRYDIHEIVEPMRQANYRALFPISILLVTDFLLRTARWRLLFPNSGSIGFTKVFDALMIGYLFNNLLPARAGELLKVVLLSRTTGRPKTLVFAAVVVEKTCDLTILMILLVVVTTFYPVPAWLNYAGIVLGGFCAATALALLALGIYGQQFVDAALKILWFMSDGLKQWIRGHSATFLAGIVVLHSVALWGKLIVLSVSIWGLELAIMGAVGSSLSLDLSFANLLFVMLLITAGTIVPSSPGYIGTYEFFGVNALSFLGISGGIALSFVVLLHATTLLGGSLIGAACLARQRAFKIPEALRELDSAPGTSGKTGRGVR